MRKAGILSAGAALLILNMGTMDAAQPTALESQPSVARSYAQRPLAFEPNRGQAEPSVRFLARGGGYSLSLRPQEALFALGKARLRMRVHGGNPRAQLIPQGQLPGRVNYLLGNDRSRWLRGIETYAQITARGVYPEIDLAYHGRQGKLEYDFLVHPGADAGRISLRFAGARGMRLDPSGGLVFDLPGGELRHLPPLIYQEIDGQRRRIEGGFQIRGDRVAFALGDYDRSRMLVIDPVLDYSTYLGGSGEDAGYAIAVDGTGAAYISGETFSADFPTASPAQPANAGAPDAFVTKLDPGGALVYSTYLGGTGEDLGRAIAIDSSGAAYVSGYTSSSDFPTASPSQPANTGGADAFVTKLDPGGALVYSTYLGGTGEDLGRTIAVDTAGAAYVGGETASTDFPTASPSQPANAGGTEAFVTKLDPGGALAYSSYLGGSGDDFGRGIAVDGSGSAYLGGATASTDFPTVSPSQLANAGGTDAFVTKLDPAGALVYSSYLGGSGDDLGNGIAVDTAGSAHVSGETVSTDFPTASPSQPANAGGTDAFVTKLDPGGALAYSSYLGGSGDDLAHGIAVDGAGSAYVGGETSSTDFPTASPSQPASAGGADAFVTKLGPGGALAYSSYLGGSGDDYGSAIDVEGDGSIYVSGLTVSTNFPTASPFQPANAGVADGFVAKLHDLPTAVTLRSFAAQRSRQGVVLRWRTGSQTGVLGFNVFVERQGRRVRLNSNVIAATAGTGGQAYSYRTTKRGTGYWLQEVRVDGSRVWHGPVQVS